MKVRIHTSRIPKNRKPRTCPGCGGSMRKGGTLRGHQMWFCRNCGGRTRFPIVGKKE